MKLRLENVLGLGIIQLFACMKRVSLCFARRLTLKLVALILELPEEEVAQQCFSNAEGIWPSS